MTFIPYGKQSIDEDDIKAVSDVLKGDWITTGPKVESFEKELSDFVGSKYSVAVNSGTSALDIAISALSLEPGSEIITTPFTFVADSNCILYNNHVPVFADINPKTYNLDPTEIRKKITKKTKAVICVDYAGQPCDLDEIKEISKDHGLYLIEDASHSLGSTYNGKKIGSLADATIFSFHPVKHMTTGEGGAISTQDKDLAIKLKMLRNHGMDKSVQERFGESAGYEYDIKLLGRNYRITDFQCALGSSQLKKLPLFLERRKKIAKFYNEHLSGISGILLPFVENNVSHAWHLYTILLENKQKRDLFLKYMRKNRIGVNVHYSPIYSFSLYSKFKIKSSDYPNTDDVSNRIISLPIYPSISEDEQKRVIDLVKKFMGVSN